MTKSELTSLAIKGIELELNEVSLQIDALTARKKDLERAFRQLSGKPEPVERTLSVEARAKISAAQKKRWAKKRRDNGKKA
jgi:hypothetical protein